MLSATPLAFGSISNLSKLWGGGGRDLDIIESIFLNDWILSIVFN